MTASSDNSTNAPGITLELPIRWGDMDALGHVNNTIYFQFCESARMAYFDAIDLTRFQSKPTDGPAIVTANLSFRRQLHYPGTVLASANVTKVSGRSFVLSYRIRNAADGETAADGDSVCVWVDYDAGKAMPLPDEMVKAFAEREQNEELLKRAQD